MKRRTYLSAVASLPALPSLPDIGKIEDEKETRTEIVAGWSYESDTGRIHVRENGERVTDWEYGEEGFGYWQNITCVTCGVLEPDLPIVYTIEGCRLCRVITDSPFFLSLFEVENEPNILLDIYDAKYSDEFAYKSRIYTSEDHVETFGNKDIDELKKEIEEYINERR